MRPAQKRGLKPTAHPSAGAIYPTRQSSAPRPPAKPARLKTRPMRNPNGLGLTIPLASHPAHPHKIVNAQAGHHIARTAIMTSNPVVAPGLMMPAQPLGMPHVGLTKPCKIAMRLAPNRIPRYARAHARIHDQTHAQTQTPTHAIKPVAVAIRMYATAHAGGLAANIGKTAQSVRIRPWRFSSCLAPRGWKPS